MSIDFSQKLFLLIHCLSTIMKMIAILLLAFFSCSLSVLAVPYNTTLGPYKISFDLGFSNYYVDVGENWNEQEFPSGEKFETGSIDIFREIGHENGSAAIRITHYETDHNFNSPETDANIIKRQGQFQDTTTRIIDGVDGWFASQPYYNNSFTYYNAGYHPSFDPKRVNVTILSVYPWDKGTSQLLKTIHVEKINSTQ